MFDHYARLTKGLRVQPFTGLAKKYARKGIISNALDLDTLQYPAHYTDERVAWVRDRFDEYESQGMHYIYGLQAACRGEGESYRARLLAKKILGGIRTIDLEHLNALIAYSAGQVTMDVIRRLTDEHTQGRTQLLARCRREEIDND